MDDVVIEDVDGDYPTDRLENQDVRTTVGEVLSQYGWFLLVLTAGLYLFLKRRTRQAPPSPPPDAGMVAKRQEAMEAARRKMQAELDAKATIFREKQQQLEQERRKQKIEMWESMKEGRSCRTPSEPPQDAAEAAGLSPTVLKPKTEKKTLRSGDYNPLTGGGSCSWRPGRRGPSSGG